jgi:hypothetical protein
MRLGHRVTAADYDELMLREIDGAETVLSRIEDLNLGRRSAPCSFVYTAHAHRQYERVGWSVLRAVEYQSKNVTIMVKDLSANGP